MAYDEKRKYEEIFCPRCDRKYTVESKLHGVTKDDLKSDLLGVVKKHVSENHPDHDQYWYETA